MDELKPCPFCGSPAFEYPDGDMEGHSIMCSGKHALFNGSEDRCPMNTFGYDSQEASIKAWNRRAALAATQAPIYQERNANGSWTDISKQFFDAHAECCSLKDRVRIVYAAPESSATSKEA